MEELRCSFCRKTQDTVRKLISSPSDDSRAYICDECVAVCSAILEDDPTTAQPARPAAPQTLDLNQVTVPSTDVARSVAFYQRLGLRLIVDALPKYARFECPSGDATFSVEEVDQVASGNGVVVYFECEDLGSTVQQLKEHGLQFDSEPVDQPWWWREAYLQDPDGNSICLFHAGSYRKNPPWRLS